MSKLISLCISCRNRLWQIQHTLADNLSTLAADMEIVLVDYGSTDGLSEWVWRNFEGAIRAGQLTFFEVTNPVTWSSPRAKNLAHRLAKGSYVFNADADNFFTPADCKLIRKAASLGLPSQQWSGDLTDGSFGRIGLPKAMFLEIGGYDENLLPMGAQDRDLLTRLATLDDKFFKIPPPLKPAIPNTPSDKVKEMGVLSQHSDPKLAYYFTNQTNNTLAYLKLQIEGPKRVGGFASFQGLLNGIPIVIDGFNHIRSSVEANPHPLPTPSHQHQPKTQRAAQLQLLLQIVQPVLAHGSQQRLKQQMPVEAFYRGRYPRAHVSHLEAVGRTLAGLAPWLELADVPAEEIPLQRDAIMKAQALLRAIVTPASPDALNFSTHDQPLVDAAYLALSILRAPNRLFVALDGQTQDHLIQALTATRAITPHNNNWLLFPAMIEACLCKLQLKFDRARIDAALAQVEKWYVGDGLYSDGQHFRMDYYNSYVFHPFLLCILDATEHTGHWSSLKQTMRQRAQRYAQLLERMVAPDGSMPAIGRSLTYRCGNMHALADLALHGQLPSDLPASQVRTAISLVTKRTMTAPNTYDANGWLKVGLAGAQPQLSEEYISTGSLYMCTQAFLALGLPASHPYWAAPGHLITTQQLYAGQDRPADKALD